MVPIVPRRMVWRGFNTGEEFNTEGFIAEGFTIRFKNMPFNDYLSCRHAPREGE